MVDRYRFFLVRIIRIIFGLFYNRYTDYKWNGGICRRCNTGWWLDGYDDDLILKNCYRCDGCNYRVGRCMATIKEYRELDKDEVKSKLRDIKLEKLLKN